MSPFQTFAVQAFHYFSRPHDSVPEGPIKSKADWRGPDMAARRSEWLTILTPEDVAEIGATADTLLNAQVPLSSIDRTAFPLPTLTSKIAN